ncbi:MAG TPA: lipoate protein ligase C-terminal domain-containing protein [Conexivisphaerales archaeon]|nr:lipoate protein ligase C-terminal domain-containing protein [Conexivisphaerales archaeon]
MGKVTKKNEGEKLYSVEVRCEGGRIESAKISGEFFAYPEGLIDSMEEALTGVDLDRTKVAQAVAGAIFWSRGTLVGLSASDLVDSIVQAGSI